MTESTKEPSSLLAIYLNFDDTIAALYKLRWQIELLFKQIKQNFPLKNIFRDNENAIKIQIYCVLIVNL
jgi:IS4 transposase